MKIRNGFLDLFVSPNGYRVVRRQEEKRIGRDRTKIEVKTGTDQKAANRSIFWSDSSNWVAATPVACWTNLSGTKTSENDCFLTRLLL
ncbi:hypothetical protein TNIN_184991 [Trichonephila inaurata madagascariensis]|uniref:Uncharacterized protein n=1 Tax=Trichonephila inaurata madagascariensis TaxID=2747483 RepID=A0A8X6M7J3_9ARAC|nr:hypothetical protein TNIN_184991 [Trichonephila inaurata madagascariensis]